jgi:PAS domain S-box-containing protein
MVHPDDRRAIDQGLAALAGGDPRSVEFRIVRPDGAVRLLQARGRLVTDAEGRPARVIGTSLDITERRATELALRASEESYRTIFQHASDAMWLDDFETGRRLEANDAACALYGYTAEEQRGLPIGALSAGVPPYTGAEARDYIARAAAGEPQRFEWLGRHKDGSPVWTEMRLRRVTVNGADRILATARGINERRAAEQALRAANEQLERRVAERTAELAASNAALAQEVAEHARAREALLGRTRELEGIFRALPDLYFRLDADLTIVDYRASSHDAFYVPPDQFLGRRLRDVMPADICDRMEAALAAAAPGAVTSVDYRLPLGDAERDYEARFFPLGDGTRVSVVRDVTEQRDAERALRAREEHFRRLIENSSDYVMLVDGGGAITYLGPSVERILGYAPEELLGRRPTDLLHPDDVPVTMAAIDFHNAHPGKTSTIQYRIRHKDGPWRWIENVGCTVAPDTAADGLMANCRDITERVVAEQALAEREERYRRLIESAGDLVVTIDAAGALTYVSPASANVLGWAPEELLGRPAAVMLHPDDLERGLGELAAVAARPGEPLLSMVRLQRKDGGARVFESVARTLSPASAADGVIAIARDVTARVEAERALRERDERFRRIIENATDFVMVCDQSGALTYVGPSSPAMLGYAPEEILGARPVDLLHPDDVAPTMRDLAWIVEHPGESFTSTFRIRHKDGRPAIENRGRPYSPTARGGIIAFGRDVTDRKRRGGGRAQQRALAGG